MAVLGGVLAIVAIAIAGTMTVARAQEKGPDGVVNYTRIDATVACAGVTPPEAMAALKQLGFSRSSISAPPRNRERTSRGARPPRPRRG